MNRYGAMAKAHWREWLPGRYRALEDPDGFFEQLGRDAAREIETLYQAIVATEPADLAEGDREGWRTMARLNAEDQILAEMILIPPGPLPQGEDPAASETPAPVTVPSELGQEEFLRALFEAEERAGLTEPFETRIDPDPDPEPPAG